MSLPQEEREELRRSVRKLLERQSPLSQVREVMDTEPGYDPALWKEMAKLGLLDLLVPGPDGVMATGFSDAAVVLEEMGRMLTPSPYLASAILATSTLASSPHDAARKYLPNLATGQLIATIAFTGPGGRLAEDLLAVRAVQDSGRWQLEGESGFALDAGIADLMVVAAGAPDGLKLFLVEKSPAVVTERVLVFDRTRRLFRVTFLKAECELLASGEEAIAIRRRTLLRGGAALASDAAGGIARVVEMSVEYAKARVQFDRPIGSFQAIKHRLADMYVASLAAAAAAGGAADGIDDEGGSGSALVTSAGVSFALDAYARVSGDAIQVYGGIGYTWEHDCHLYFKRAQLDAALLGDPAGHRAELAQAILSRDR